MNTNDGASPKTSDIQCSATSYGGGTYEIELENQADSILLTPTRNGWSFVNWKDVNGSELSADNLMDSQTYYAQWIDDIKPALSVQVTANVASKQTATITATDAGTGVAAYYIGKQNPATTSVNFTNSASGTYTGSITSDSTWYFAVKDAAGNMQVSSKDFCKVMFGLASGETISPSTIVIEKGKQVTLPNPSKAGYSFKGWSNVQNPDIANISTFFTKVKVDNSMTVYPCFVDDIAPVLTVNAATGGIGSSGTISITNATEQGSGIAGYYIGQTKPNASGSNVTFGTTTSVTVNNSGAWYVVAKDKAGNLSGVQSFVYYQLTLNADGATNYTTAIYSTMIADSYTQDLDILKKITIGALVHDVGKAAIAKNVLEKKGKLTDTEMKLIRKHCVIGAEMIADMFDKEVQQIVLMHHEKLDGSGYPLGTTEIPSYVQLVTVADIYDALVSNRCYKKAYSHEKAIEMLRKEAVQNKINKKYVERINALRQPN